VNLMQKTLLKRLLLLLMAFSLVLAVMPAVLAQESEGGGEATTEETTETTTEETTEEETEATAGEAAEAAAEGEPGSVLDPLGINAGLLFVQIFNFLILAFIVSQVLWKPAVNFLDSRSAEIQKGLEDAAAAAKARENAEQEAETIRADARQQSNQSIEEARAQAEDIAKGIEREARAEAEKIRSDAQQEARVARDAELSGLRDQVLNISVALSRRIIGEALDEDRQRQLVSDFFGSVPESAKGLSGEVEVVSAMPLTDDEQSSARSEIGADSISFTVEPAILGGVIVRAQEKVIDASVRGGLDDLSQRLQ
jgi:F-type H+-transporting ATPase subunit b